VLKEVIYGSRLVLVAHDEGLRGHLLLKAHGD
jgi:hypothetical protein